jgi:predicted transposase YdaD
MPEPPPKPYRTHYDWLIKSVVGRFGDDLAGWLLGERPASAVALRTALPEVTLADADSILDVRFRDRPPLLLHVEFQLEHDPEMPDRMARYLLGIHRLLLEPAHRGKRMAGVVIYLDPHRYGPGDPGLFDIQGDLGTRLFATYSVVKLWEMDPGPVLALESPGLCPFVPLMRGNPVGLLVQSRDKIVRTHVETISTRTKRELLEVLELMAGLLMDREFVMALLAEFSTKERKNPLLEVMEENLEKGLKEGRQEGRQEEAVRAVQRVLKARFGEIDQGAEDRLRGIEDIDTLEVLIEAAVLAPSLEAFLAHLPPQPAR